MGINAKAIRPEPIILFELPILLLSILQNFPYHALIMLHCALLCFISSLSSCYLSLRISTIFRTLELPASLDYYVNVLLEYIDRFQQISENYFN